MKKLATTQQPAGLSIFILLEERCIVRQIHIGDFFRLGFFFVIEPGQPFFQFVHGFSPHRDQIIPLTRRRVQWQNRANTEPVQECAEVAGLLFTLAVICDIRFL